MVRSNRSAFTGIVAVAAVLFLTTHRASAQPCLSEAFPYGAGPTSLLGQGPAAVGGIWTDTSAGPLGAGDINVLNNQVRITYDADGVDNGDYSISQEDLGCPACFGTGKVSISFTITDGAAHGAAGFIGGIDVFDSNNNLIARFDLQPTLIRPRLGAGIVGIPNIDLTAPGVHGVRAAIDVVATSTEFFHTPPGGSESSVGTLDWNAAWPANSTIERVDVRDIDRQDVGSGTFDIDDMMMIRCEGSCLAEVAPAATERPLQFVAALGAASVPTSDTLTITNVGAVPVTYTVAETDADGAASDHSWLSLDTAVGAVDPLESDIVTASVDPVTPGLTAGIYTGYATFEDDCGTASSEHVRGMHLVVGADPCFVEGFPYADGLLGTGLGGWSGGSNALVVGADPDDGTNQVLEIILDPNAAGGDETTATIPVDCGACEDGTITATALVKRTTVGSAGSQAWFLDFESAGANLAHWEGRHNEVRGRTGGGSVVTPFQAISDTQFDELKVVIDTLNNTTAYYVNDVQLGTTQSHGVDLGSFQSGVGDSIQSISITRRDNGPLTGSVYLDDLQVVACEGTCWAIVRVPVGEGGTDLPFAPSAGAAAVPALVNYLVDNDSLETITYTIDEQDVNGSSTDHTWLNLVGPPSGGPLAQPDFETRTYNYDTTGLPVGLTRGFLEFTDSCSPNRTYLRAVNMNVGLCLTEDFNLPDGDLEKKPFWGSGTPIAVASPIAIDGQILTIAGYDGGAEGQIEVDAVSANIENCGGCPADGIFVTKMKVRGHVRGGGVPAGPLDDFWEVHFTPLNTATILGGWQGGSDFVRPMAGAAIGTEAALATGPGFQTIEIRINTNASTTLDGIPPSSSGFFLDGTLIDTLSHTAGDGARVRFITFLRNAQDVGAQTDPVIEIDDVTLTACAPRCPSPVFDVRDVTGTMMVSDGHVSAQDFNVFEACATGPTPAAGVFDALSFECQCMDVSGPAGVPDMALDQEDFARLQRCETGVTLVVDPACDD